MSRLDMFSLEGKVCVLSGAAGGLGSAIATGFADIGADLVLLDLSPSRLELLADRLALTGARPDCLEADVTNPSQVQEAVKQIAARHKVIDVLVNVHGVNVRVETEKMPLPDWQRVMDVNLKGTFLMCQEVGKIMVGQKHGKIINMSSSAGERGYTWGYSAYSPSKAAVEGLTRTLAVEWGKYGINVNAVAPYFIRTEMTKTFLQNPEVSNDLIRLVPLGRLGTPEDVVGVMIFLASDASNWVSGQVVHVDGGRGAA